MENVKYIPGDLVKINGVVNVIDGIYSKSFSKDRVIEANALEDADTARHRYDLDFGRVVTIEPIQLTPKILEANGWDLSIIKNRNYWSKVSSNEELLRFKSIDASVQRIAVKDKIALIYFSSNPNAFFFELPHKVIKIKYIHELQHLLFGLGLDSSLKV